MYVELFITHTVYGPFFCALMVKHSSIDYIAFIRVNLHYTRHQEKLIWQISRHHSLLQIFLRYSK